MIDPGYRSNSVRNCRNCIYQESIRNWTKFWELEGIPRNSGITSYIRLLGYDESWLPIEFRTEFRELEGIPRNSGITSYIGLLGYDRSWPSFEFRTEFPDLYLPGIDPELDGIPGIGRNSGITNYIRLLGYDGSWLPIEFRNHRLHRLTWVWQNTSNSGIPSNSQEFLPIPRNSYQFRLYPILGIPWRNCFLPSPSLSTMYMVID
jgi:hypothetical protein